MINADKFEQVFGIYATELWAKPEKEFLEWLNNEAQGGMDMKDVIYREDATRYFIGLRALDKITNDNYDGKITFEEVISRLGVIPSAYLTYADSDIPKMQDLEQAQLDKAYELGKAEAERTEIIRCKDCKRYDGRPCGLVNWYNTDNDYCSKYEGKG